MMTTRRSSIRRVEEEIANAEVPTQYNQAPPQEQAPLGDQALANPLVMIDVEIRTTFINLAQPMTTQAQVVYAQAQAMTAQAN